MSLLIITGNDVEFLLSYAKRKAKARNVQLYDKLRMGDVDEIKKQAMSGRGKVIILNGNNVTISVYDALLKSIEESKANFFICTTKDVPSTILSRGNIIELLEAPESKLQKLVFRGVNRVEADELLSVFGSAQQAIEIFNIFTKYEGEYVALFQNILSRNFFEVWAITREWPIERLRLLGFIADIMISTSVLFGVRKYFIDTLGINKVTVSIIDRIRSVTRATRNPNIIRLRLCWC